MRIWNSGAAKTKEEQDMGQTKKRKTDPRILADCLMTLLGATLSSALPTLVSFPRAESFLIGWAIAFSVAYFIRPHPPVSFVRWTLERQIMLACFYLFVFKIPLLLKPWLITPLAYGIPIALLLAASLAWVIYGRKLFSVWTNMTTLCRSSVLSKLVLQSRIER
jgi:hypothetical protein